MQQTEKKNKWLKVNINKRRFQASHPARIKQNKKWKTKLF